MTFARPVSGVPAREQTVGHRPVCPIGACVSPGRHPKHRARDESRRSFSPGIVRGKGLKLVCKIAFHQTNETIADREREEERESGKKHTLACIITHSNSISCPFLPAWKKGQGTKTGFGWTDPLGRTKDNGPLGPLERDCGKTGSEISRWTSASRLCLRKGCA